MIACLLVLERITCSTDGLLGELVGRSMDCMVDGASFVPAKAIHNALLQVDNTTELGPAYMSIM